MIPFSRPSITDREEGYLLDALHNSKLSGDGKYTKTVRELMKNYGVDNFLLTNSGTDALELAALLTDIGPGDEFICPSFTFSSTANAFMLRGAKPVFCEVRAEDMNMDVDHVRTLITPKTKVIVTVDYGGVPVDYDALYEICEEHNLQLVADAAQSVGSTYKQKPSGTLAPISCFSFHETKNYIMGEGGGICLETPELLARAEILREKGTDRSRMIRGQVDKYTWHAVGSSFLPSDLLASILTAQLERFDEIMEKRMAVWNRYHAGLEALQNQGLLRRAEHSADTRHNAHLYFILLNSREERDALMDELSSRKIYAYFHYLPLHSAPLGQSMGYKAEDLPRTEDLAGRLLRLPLFPDMTTEEVDEVIRGIKEYFAKK